MELGDILRALSGHKKPAYEQFIRDVYGKSDIVFDSVMNFKEVLVVFKADGVSEAATLFEKELGASRSAWLKENQDINPAAIHERIKVIGFPFQDLKFKDVHKFHEDVRDFVINDDDIVKVLTGESQGFLSGIFVVKGEASVHQKALQIESQTDVKGVRYIVHNMDTDDWVVHETDFEL